jgi:4-amino-4-deoxy-L-arabinose transferase-like glycosyltransferase
LTEQSHAYSPPGVVASPEQSAHPEAKSGHAAARWQDRALTTWRWAREGTRRWHLLSGFGLAVLLLLIVLFGTDSGISYDEYAHRTYGDFILAWFQSGFTDRSAMHFRNFYLYAGGFDLPAQWIVHHSPLGVYETRHILSALTAVLGIVATWRLGILVAGPRAGFLSALILALTPCWVGHGLMNPKDIPFAAATGFVSVVSLRLALGEAPFRARDIVLAGLTVGVALAVRPGGNFVIMYPLMAAGLRLVFDVFQRWQLGVRLKLVRSLGSYLSCVLSVVVLGWLIMVATWPWAQLHPIDNPVEAMKAARHFGWPGTLLFEGKYVKGSELPLRYLPVLFKITLPELYYLAAGAASVLLVRLCVRRTRLKGRRSLAWLLLASYVVIPFAALLITRPVLYDAHRHVLFLLPPAAALAGGALSELFAASWLPRLVRGAVAGAIAVLGVLVVVDMVQLHPFEYTYFNRLSGGLKGNYRRFDTDYWSIGYQEGLELVLEKFAPAPPAKPLRVISCDECGDDRLQYYVNRTPGAAERVVVTSDYAQADVLIAVRRAECHRKPGVTLATVKRQGTPLVYVRRIVH